MSQNKFQVLTLIAEDFIKSLTLTIHFVNKQILNTILAYVVLSITFEKESGIEVCIIPESFFYILHVEIIFSK